MTVQFENKITKRIVVLIFSIASILPVFSQFESQLSQYMFHPAVFNPASIGEGGMVNVTGQHRIQWLGMPGAPQTTFFSLNAPFKMGKTLTQAVGLKFLNDKIGAFSNQSANFQYALKKNIDKGVLSIGTDIGFVSVGFMYDSIKNSNISSEYHDITGDTHIPTADETGMNLDLSLGVFYSAPKYYVGISYVHLNNPVIKLGDKSKFNIKGVVYATGGYDLAFENPKLVLRSSALLKSDYKTWQTDLSTRMEYDKRFWGGLSYRYQDAIVVLAGMNLFSGISIGYAYDLPTGKMLTVSSGSHEFYLSYSFAFDTSKNKNRYKSIRIL